ncbi:CDP-diacylglycerol diphosphatase [Streptomyces sp. NPDC004286]|uniref:CDP-diacylglycerol diphosphatase n=1 Tax=Streptomyces sp. NPDC004286 TaxID=3364696 RepID=UPI0036761F5B
MNDQQNANDVPRRQFVALSGAVGAATLLTGAAALSGGTAAAASGGDAGPTPDTCPTTPPPPGGASPCPPAQLQGICGRPTDNEPLWNDVQYCVNGTVPPSGQKPDCLKMTPNYIVLHGKPQSTQNYLLVPTCRITGIECPFLETSGVANYWHEAWETGRSGGDVPVQSRYIGFGINSQGARQLNQLHIHMAGVRPSTQRRLQDLEAQGRMATSPSQWAAPANHAPITGTGGDREYRILRLPNLTVNLFDLVYRYVARPNSLSMADQTIIVVPKITATGGFANAFYVLNSDNSLHDGTSTCDRLLVY